MGDTSVGGNLVGEIEASAFRWVVQNFSTAGKHIGLRELSPIFTTSSAAGETEWQLWLYPKGYSERAKDYLSIYIHKLRGADVVATVAFSLLDSDNKKIAERKAEKHEFLSGGKGWGFSEFMNQSYVLDPKNRILRNKRLTVMCELMVDDPVSPAVVEDEASKSVWRNEDKRVADFRSLIESGKYSDVTLTSEGARFSLHKSILTARSSVFAAMFEHDMREKDENVVEINDVGSHVLEKLVEFIYTGRIADGLEEMAGELLASADKYCIEDLKELCEEILSKKMDSENVTEILQLAYLHNTDELKNKAVEFFVKNSLELLQEPEFVSFAKAHPELMCEILKTITEQIADGTMIVTKS